VSPEKDLWQKISGGGKERTNGGGEWQHAKDRRRTAQPLWLLRSGNKRFEKKAGREKGKKGGGGRGVLMWEAAVEGGEFWALNKCMGGSKTSKGGPQGAKGPKDEAELGPCKEELHKGPPG